MLEAGQVAAHDDDVHALGVLDVEVAHGPAVAAGDAEAELEALAPGRGRAGELERQAPVAHREAADRLHDGRFLAVPGHGRRGVGLAGVDVDAAAGERGAAEREHEQGGEPGELRGGAHADTAS